MGSPLLALWRTRGILWLLIRRELKVRYASSKLGYVWTILDPLATCLVFWLVFGFIFAGARGENSPDPYIVFLIAGYLPWMCIAGSINESAKSITAEAKLVRSTSLPRELWLLRTIGAKLCELVLSLPILIVFMIGFQVWPTSGVVYLPLAFLLMILPMVGIGLALAPLCVLYKDLNRVVRIFMRLLFYMTPVLYASNLVVEALEKHESLTWLGHLYFANPFVAVIDLFRTALWNSGPENQFPGWDNIGISFAVGMILLGVGLTIFRRLEGAVLKEI